MVYLCVFSSAGLALELVPLLGLAVSAQPSPEVGLQVRLFVSGESELSYLAVWLAVRLDDLVLPSLFRGHLLPDLLAGHLVAGLDETLAADEERIHFA